MTYLYSVFGYVLEFFYKILNNNYVLAIIAFTFITRIIFLPTYIPQQKNQAKQFRIQPKLQKLQQKFGNDRQKLQEEQQNLYNKEGFNPMSAGCLPMIISLPLLWGVFGAITRPITSVLHLGTQFESFYANETVKELIKSASSRAAYQEIISLDAIKSGSGELFKLAQKFFSSDQITSIRNFAENFTLFGLSLTTTPSIKEPSIYWAIPILAGITSFLTSFYSMQRQKKVNPVQAQAGNAMSNGCMMVAMPLFSVYICFIAPAGVGFYWIISNLFALIQTVVLSNVYAPPKVAANNMVNDVIYKCSYEQSVKNRNNAQ